MAKSEEGRKLDLYQLKQCVVQLHELVQLLHKEAALDTCQTCLAKIALQKTRSAVDKAPSKMAICRGCKLQFVHTTNKDVIANIVDIILMLGDAGVPLPPKRETWPT